MRIQQGLVSLVSILTTSFVPGPICVDALPDVFTAVIAGMECSLYLVVKGNLLKKKKSSVQCMTKHTVMVQSAIVISDNTNKIFNLTLRAKVKNTKLIRGVLLPVPEDINLATKSIQHQGPADEPVDLQDVIKQLNGSPRVSINKQGISVNCTYQEPGEVKWSKCQETGIKIKILRIINKRKQNECFKYRTMTSKCEGGSRGYHRNVASSPRNLAPASEETKIAIEEEANDAVVIGYKIKIPIEANTTGGNDAQIDNVPPVSPGDIVEGDMKISPNQKTHRNAMLGSTKWPGNTLYYYFDWTVSSGDRNSINVGLGLLQSKLGQCVKFVQRTWGDRVKVKSLNDGCWAQTGYQRGEQEINLQSHWLFSRCITNGIIQHEFLHALGLEHEQGRSDRHLYMSYFENNVECPTGNYNDDTCMRYNFKSYSVSQVSHYGLNYDYESVMHYGKDDFTNGNGNTLEAKDSYWTDKIGQRVGVSLGDVELIQRHYGCPVVIQWKGRWGSFPSSPTFCPSGSFVFGYRLRSESAQGGGDDTALNDIELYCRRPNSETVIGIIYSDYRTWGSWSSATYCSGTSNPVVGFDVKEEGSQGGGDDTALNDVDLYCKLGDYVSARVNTYWGSWKPKQMCPAGFAVMGIRTQVEGNQGGGDNTAVNGVELYCKPYPNGSW